MLAGSELRDDDKHLNSKSALIIKAVWARCSERVQTQDFIVETQKHIIV